MIPGGLAGRAHGRGRDGGGESGTGPPARCLPGDALAAVVGAEHVRRDAGALRVYAQDATPLHRGHPDVVVFPGSTAEVAAVVALAAELGVPVIPRGAGTNLSAGTIAHRGGIMLTLTRMNRLVELDLDNLVAVCQPGLTTAGWPPPPPSTTCSTRPTRAAGRRRRSAATWPRTRAGCAASSTG